MKTTCVQQVTEHEFEQIVLQSNEPVLVDFYTKHCGPCKMMAPVLEDVCQERDSSLTVVKINAEENIALANTFEVQSVPTFIVFKDGKPIARRTGSLAKRLFEEWIDSSLAN